MSRLNGNQNRHPSSSSCSEIVSNCCSHTQGLTAHCGRSVIQPLGRCTEKKSYWVYRCFFFFFRFIPNHSGLPSWWSHVLRRDVILLGRGGRGEILEVSPRRVHPTAAVDAPNRLLVPFVLLNRARNSLT